MRSGYDWYEKNWGTPCIHIDIAFERLSDVSAGYWFETKWSPAVYVVRAMGQQFPMLRFKYKYFEAYLGYRGSWKCEDGVMTGTHEDYDYNEEDVVEGAADSFGSSSSPEGGKPENGEEVVERPT